MVRQNDRDRKLNFSVFFSVIFNGTAWGIFEATVGYILHEISFGYSWLIWCPVASFFMANVYRRTKRASAVFFTGLLCASVKMLNLLLPVRVDRVINPAISIVLEALVMSLVIIAARKFLGEKIKSPIFGGLAALSANTLWRLMFILYLLLLAPDWMREISVISSTEKFLPFFIYQNLITSLIISIGFYFRKQLFAPIKALEEKISRAALRLPRKALLSVKIFAAAALLALDILLELLL